MTGSRSGLSTWGHTAVVGAVVFWSIGNLIVKGSDLTGPQIAFWRYLIAAAIYCVAHLLFVGPLRWSDFKLAAPTGLVIAAEIVAFFIAINNTTVANVSIIGNLTPLLLLGVAATRFSERVPARIVVATVVAIGGVAAVVFGAAGERSLNPKGDGLAVVALFLFAAYFTLAKEARQKMGAFTLQAHSLIVGLPLIGAALFIETGGLPVPISVQWWSVLGLVALPGTGHLLINWAHAHVSLTLASLLTLGVPVLSVIGAYFLFDEGLVFIQVAGMAVVLGVLAYAIVETTNLSTSHI